MQANSLVLLVDSDGNKILSVDEKIYNGETIKSIAYMDKDGKFLSKIVDKNGKEVDPLLLIPKDKSLFKGKLKKILKAKDGDLDFISDDEELEVVIALPYEHIKLNLEPSTLEIYIDNDGKEKEIKLNGKKVDKKTIEDKQNKYMMAIDKAREKRIVKTRKKIEVFAKRNGLENDSTILEALKNAKSSIKLKLKKGELKKFASKNKDLIIGIELGEGKISEFLEGAMLSTKVNPYARNIYNNSTGAGVGIYMSESLGCPDTGTIYIPSGYTRLSGSSNDHSTLVGGIIRGVSPDSYIYCRSNYSLPTYSDLISFYSSYGNPRVYVENYAWGDMVNDNGDYLELDRDFDNHIYENMVTSFLAAGNGGNQYKYNYVTRWPYSTHVLSPAKALNGISVGNYDDSTDRVFIESSFKDSEIGNNKPEIVAPGTDIVLNSLNDSGTSFATPHATGFAADLMSAYGSYLKLYPHLTKALILSGATKVIEDVNGGTVDEDKTGVGGIDFYNTYYSWAGLSWDDEYISSFSYYDSIDSYPNNNALDGFVYLQANKKTRAVISWLNSGDYLYDHKTDAYPLAIDFDLYIFDPYNNLVGYSNSRKNPYEVVNFTPSISGYYRIAIAKYTFRDTNSKLHVGSSINWE